MPEFVSLPEPMDVVLEVRNLGKSFPGVRALDEVSLTLRRGEVRAVVGENGAGKSTLMRLLAGLEEPDAGEIRFRGRPVRMRDPHTARALGVAMIHQELMPFPDLSVAENIMMGREPTRGLLGWVDRRALRRRARALLDCLDLTLSPDCLMRELGVAEMQAVEIAKAIGGQAELLIMDEPTSSLSAHETRALFRVIGDLRTQGVAILYISHRLEEVFALADTVTVLRDGHQVFTGPINATSREQLIQMMVGRTLAAPGAGGCARQGAACSAEVASPALLRAQPQFLGSAPRPPGHLPSPPQTTGRREQGDVALAPRGLGRKGAFADISFTVHRGEVVGLTGLVGAGRTELAEALFGLVAADAGTIEVHGRPVKIRSPRQALGLGIALVTEDRKHDGLVLTLSVMHNLTLAGLARCSPGGWINGNLERRLADGLIENYGIKVAHRGQPTGTLSGGNQQKVALAKALLTEPEILLLDEPTRGIDVGAKSEVYALIRRLAREHNKAVLLISSELPEVLALSDRVLVMREGRLRAELEPERTTPAEVLQWAMPD